MAVISQMEPKFFTSFASDDQPNVVSQYKVNRKIESAKSAYSFDSNPSIVR